MIFGGGGGGGGGVVAYKVDINNNGWGKEKPNEEKLFLRFGPSFLGLKF